MMLAQCLSILLSQVLVGFAVTTHTVKGHNKVQGVVYYLAMSALNSTYSKLKNFRSNKILLVQGLGVLEIGLENCLPLGLQGF